jgi:ribonuclease HII
MIIGVDEVGTGALAGPICVGAAIAPNDVPNWNLGVRDSKKMSRESREAACIRMKALGVKTAVGWSSSAEVDTYGMRISLQMAASRAIERVCRQIDPAEPISLLIDGNWDFNIKGAFTVVKGDATVPVISAASVVAKVARDKLMIALSKKYPAYGWEKGVGYGTEQHLRKLYSVGPCVHHRVSTRTLQAYLLQEKEKYLEEAFSIKPV